MNTDEIKELLALMAEHQLSELELEREGARVKLVKGHPSVALPAPAASAEPPATRPASGHAVPAEGAVEATAEASDLVIVTSPIVGTFYRAPDPNSPSFVEIGDTVRKGQVLCIIEAMKLMNEIDSEHEGEVVNIYVENGQPVQYGERLFALRPV